MAKLGSSALAVFSALIDVGGRLAGRPGATDEGTGRAARSGTGVSALPRVQTFEPSARRAAASGVFPAGCDRGADFLEGMDRTTAGGERPRSLEPSRPICFAALSRMRAALACRPARAWFLRSPAFGPLLFSMAGWRARSGGEVTLPRSILSPIAAHASAARMVSWSRPTRRIVVTS